jgi:thiosulfate dehydrogenase
MMLVRHTARYLGPKGSVRQITNGMNCQNCHLDAGTRLYANSYSAVYANYPKFRERSGTVEHLERRINDCMERSLNGKKLDSLSREMRAIVAYINWVGKDVKKGVIPEGAAVVNLPWLGRAADKANGKIVFRKNCVTCHGTNGEGQMDNGKMGYTYPPLWGPHSYNTSAGMYRITKLAGFIKSNMPNLTSSYSKPILTDEEAWDIAAYICSMPRPYKKFKNDWPDITGKPADYPYGPYADYFSEKRHKYGPFKEILMEAQNRKLN